MAAKLNGVSIVQALGEPGVYSLLINVTDEAGTRDQWFVSRPDDPFGLGPEVRCWLAENPDVPIGVYSPPTADEIRAHMAVLPRLEFRNKFKAAGMTTEVIAGAIASVSDESDREDMQIAWEDTQTFGRLDPLVIVIATFAGKSPEQIDAIWTA